VVEPSWVTGASPIDVLLVEDLSQQRLPARTLAAVLRQAGLRTRLINFASDQDISAVIRVAQSERPSLVVLSILFAHRLAEHLTLLAAMREAGVRAHFTMVGPLPSFAWAELLATCPALDSVLCGEAETSIVQLATGLEVPAHWQAVPGLACRFPTPRVNPLPKPLPNFYELPFSIRDDGIPAYLGYGFATVEASRGCYHTCTFCLPCAFHRATGVPYRLRHLTNLVDEIEVLYRRGVRLFLFDDEQFLPPGRARKERAAALSHELERRGLRIAFTIKCRADDVDAALFRQLREMGLLRVYIGIESGCQASLDLLGKGVTGQRNAEALALLEELDIVADFRSLLFHPWSTLETVQDEIVFLNRVAPYMSTCFSFREVEVYPGTPLVARLQAEGRGESGMGPLSYSLADPRVELLRRLSRFVFDPHGAYGDIQSLLTRAWYELLLQRRFQPERCEPTRAHELKAIAAGINAQSLRVWQEMLAFVSEGDIYDADQVNERACAWAGRIHALQKCYLCS
jgi:hypothetical protein